MAASKKNQDASAEELAQDVGESINELGSATADLGREAQEQVTNLTEQVRQQATDQLTSQKERVVDTLETVALLLHQAGEQAQQQEKTLVASYADKAAQRVGGFSESLAQQDVTQIVETTKNYARREPMLFVGGALAAGFLGARFLRSSAQQVQQTSQDQGPSGDAELATVGDTASDLPAYDMDQTTTASSEGMLGSTSTTPADVMTPDTGSFMEDYEAAVLEDDAISGDMDSGLLPDIEDIERPENL
jgi:ElaB/YqjD/DUF883 family membrane-anchored ribosome-binding protein